MSSVSRCRWPHTRGIRAGTGLKPSRLWHTRQTDAVLAPGSRRELGKAVASCRRDLKPSWLRGLAQIAGLVLLSIMFALSMSLLGLLPLRAFVSFVALCEAIHTVEQQKAVFSCPMGERQFHDELCGEKDMLRAAGKIKSDSFQSLAGAGRPRYAMINIPRSFLSMAYPNWRAG